MLTKQDLIDMLNEMRDVPNDAHVLIDNGQYGIQTLKAIKHCVFERSERFGSYREPASIYTYNNPDQIYGPYKHGIQIVLGDSI